ncbi:MAG: hypothetical protein WBA18_06385 [Terracidiphilus sp.]
MDPNISGRQLRLVWGLYALAGVVSALMIAQRYMQYALHPQDAAAASGMYAGGDLALEFIVCFLLLVPTAALAITIRKSEPAYTLYSKVLLGLTITAPLSLVLVPIPFFSSWQLGDLLLFRLFTIPVVLFVLVCSLLLTRFAHARRFIFYALLVEGLSLVACFAGMLFLMRR